jgi:symplekin
MKIHQHIERLMRSRTEIFDEATRKRGPPGPIDDPAKRQRVIGPGAAAVASRLHIPPLVGKGPYSIADLFTLSSDAAGFDVSGMAEDMVIRVGMSALQRVDADTFNQAINVSPTAGKVQSK